MKQNQTFSCLGVVGAGAMGAGIAQVAAEAGLEVRLFDARPEAAQQADAAIRQRQLKRVEQGKMAADDAQAAGRLLQAVPALEALADCDIVIEAIVEDIQVKQTLLLQLEACLRPDAVLASNTSSIPIGVLASACDRRERVAGLHFFNPVPVMKLVEVIPGPDTTPEIIQGLVELGRRLGKTPVVARDMPGFLVNYGGRAYPTEALAIVHEGVATPAQVDEIMRDAYGFRMGPFELMDLTGMDVNFPVTSLIHERFYAEPRLRSTPLHRYMLETGQLGRKTGKGFYRYEPPQAQQPAVFDAEPVRAVCLHGASSLQVLVAQAGAQVLERDDGVAPILIEPMGSDCSTYAATHGLDHRRLIAVDTLGDVSRRITLMRAPVADEPNVRRVAALFAQSRSVSLIHDSPGFVGPRIVAMVANLGCEMAQTGLASVEDIDLAMRLGLNYPQGPLEMADSLGVGRLHGLLGELQSITGDDRYRPSLWLRRRAQLGLSAKDC